MESTKITTWFERDRQHVALQYNWGADIVEWWDDEVTEAVEDGFLDPKDYHGSADAYADERGLLCEDEKILALAEHLEVSPDEITEESWGAYTVGHCRVSSTRRRRGRRSAGRAARELHRRLHGDP